MSNFVECYYHPGHAMAGICKQCGKAACRDCLEAVAGGMLCVDCAFISHDTYVAKVQSTMVRAQWRVIRAGICGIIGLVAGIYIGWMHTIGHNGNPLSILGYGLLCPYMGWGWYWGATIVGTWWRRLLSECLIFGSLRLLAFLVLIVPLVASYVIGVFGGGIAAYLHNRHLIAHMQATIDAA
jgi:hypothetical protein